METRKGGGFYKEPKQSHKIVMFGSAPKESVLKLRDHKGILPLGYEVPVYENYSIKKEKLRISTYSV